jgi:hypothetical protein
MVSDDCISCTDGLHRPSLVFTLVREWVGHSYTLDFLPTVSETDNSLTLQSKIVHLTHIPQPSHPHNMPQQIFSMTSNSIIPNLKPAKAVAKEPEWDVRIVRLGNPQFCLPWNFDVCVVHRPNFNEWEAEPMCIQLSWIF